MATPFVGIVAILAGSLYLLVGALRASARDWAAGWQLLGGGAAAMVVPSIGYWCVAAALGEMGVAEEPAQGNLVTTTTLAFVLVSVQATLAATRWLTLRSGFIRIHGAAVEPPQHADDDTCVDDEPAVDAPLPRTPADIVADALGLPGVSGADRTRMASALAHLAVVEDPAASELQCATAYRLLRSDIDGVVEVPVEVWNRMERGLAASPQDSAM